METTASKHRRREEELRSSLDDAHSNLSSSPSSSAVTVDHRVRSLEKEVATLNRANETLQRDLNAERTRVAKLSQLMENSLMDASSVYHSLREDIADSSMGILRQSFPLDTSLVCNPLAFSVRLDTPQERSEEQLQALSSQELESLGEQAKLVEELSEELVKSTEERDTIIAELKGRLAELEHKLMRAGELKGALKDAERKQLETHYAQWEKERSELLDEIEQLKCNLAASEEVRKSHVEKAVVLETSWVNERSQLLNVITEIKGKLAVSESKLRQAVERAGGSEAVEKLRKNLAQCYRDHNETLEELDATQLKLEASKKETQAAMARLDIMVSKYQAMSRLKNASELQEQVDVLEERLATCVDRNRFLDEENDILMKMKNELERTRREIREKLEELEPKLAEQANKLAEQETKLAEQANKLAEQELSLVTFGSSKSNREHKQEVIVLRCKLRESEVKLAKANESVRERDELRSDLQKKTVEISLKKDEVAFMMNLVGNLEFRLERVEASKGRLEAELAREKTRKLHEELQSRKEQIARLQLQIDLDEMPYKLRVAEVEGTSKTLREENSKLEDCLRKAQADLNTTKVAEDCPACVRRFKNHHKEVQTEPSPLSMTSVGSGILREHSYQEMQRQCNVVLEKKETYKRILRDRLAYIKQLETEKENADPGFKRKYQTK